MRLLLPQLVGLPRGEIDPVIFEHARVVDPVIVENLRHWFNSAGDVTTGWDGVKVFKHVFRFWKVLQAYQSKRKGWSRAKGKEVLKRLQESFGGTSPSGLLRLLCIRR